MNKISATLLIVAIIISACGPSESQKSTQAAAAPCSVARVEKFDADAKKIVTTDWDAAYKLASQSPRMSLTVPISNMQAARKAASEIETPECLKVAAEHLLTAMDNSINGFLAFLGNKDDDTVNDYLNSAGEKMKSYINEVNRIKACAPDC